MLTRNKLLVAALVILAFVVASFFVPIYGDICRENAHTGQKDCATNYIALVALWHIGEFLNYYGVAITAVATGAIGYFTYTLYRATSEQARLTRETIQIARDEFISTHRPKIVIHSLWLMLDMIEQNTDDATIRAEIIYFNVGATPARVVEITAKISRRALPLQTGITTWATQAVPAEPIVGGGKGYISVKSDIRLNHERTIQQSEASPRGAVFCMGKITYEDDLGVRRETGFCRQLDAVAERWFNPGDVRTPQNSEYEYSY